MLLCDMTDSYGNPFQSTTIYLIRTEAVCHVFHPLSESTFAFDITFKEVTDFSYCCSLLSYTLYCEPHSSYPLHIIYVSPRSEVE